MSANEIQPRKIKHLSINKSILYGGNISTFPNYSHENNNAGVTSEWWHDDGSDSSRRVIVRNNDGSIRRISLTLLIDGDYLPVNWYKKTGRKKTSIEWSVDENPGKEFHKLSLRTDYAAFKEVGKSFLPQVMHPLVEEFSQRADTNYLETPAQYIDSMTKLTKTKIAPCKTSVVVLWNETGSFNCSIEGRTPEFVVQPKFLSVSASLVDGNKLECQWQGSWTQTIALPAVYPI